MASWSNVSVPAAPAAPSYAAPLLNFAPLGELANDYYKGAQQSREYNAANAFPNGVPRVDPNNPNSPIDVNAIANAAARYGGVSAAQGLLPFLQKQQILNEDVTGGGQPSPFPGQPSGAQPPQPQPGPAPAPRILTPLAGDAPPPAPPIPSHGIPAPSTTAHVPGGDNGQTLMSLVTDRVGGEQAGKVVADLVRMAPQIGDPNAPQKPERLANIGKFVDGYLKRTPGLGAQPAVAGPAVVPAIVAQGPAAAPSPAPGVAPQALSPAATMVPAAFRGRELDFAQQLRANADQTRLRARREGIVGIPSKAMEDRAAAYDAQAAKIEEALSTAAQPTPEQKNATASGGLSPLQFENAKIIAKVAAENTARTPEQKLYEQATTQGYRGTVDQFSTELAGRKKAAEVGAENSALTPEQKNARGAGAASPLDYQRQQEQQKVDITAGEKKYEGIQHQADEAHNLVQTLKLNQSLMDDPNFYSGSGEQYNLMWKRIGASLGLTNPDAAVAQEAFRKTVSSAILDQIRSLGGQGLGQVRVAEINVMKAAAQNEENTPAANRLLSEMQMRLASKWTLPIAELAQAYKDGGQVTIDGQTYTLPKHGTLDAGFDKLKTKYINEHPLLSKEDLEDTRRIAPPLVRSPADLKRIGWKDGAPFRTPDGRIFTHYSPQGPQ